MKDHNMNSPEGAIKSIKELEALIDKAKTTGTTIPLWRLFPIIGARGDSVSILVKRLITPTSGVNQTRGVVHLNNSNHKEVDALLGEIGLHSGPTAKKVYWYFTNFWQAWAFLQRVLEEQRKAT